MKQYKHLWLLILGGAIFLTSCSKHDTITEQSSGQPGNGFFILNQGGFNDNNATLTYYDFTTNKVSDDVFSKANKIGLGDVAQDFIIYGNKIYISVNNSNHLFVIDLNTQKLLDSVTIPLPRYIVSYQGNVFVSAWDNNVYEIDTASFAVKKKIPLSGKGADGMAIVGNKLFVSNSGGYDIDSTISIVDLNSLQEIQKAKVGYAPNTITVSADNKLYITCAGHTYSSPILPSYISVFNTNTLSLEKIIDNAASGLSIYNGNAYGISQVYNPDNSSTITYPEIDLSTNTISEQNFISGETGIVAPYGINTDPQNGDIYIEDASTFTQNGTIYCFSQDGTLKFNTSSNGIAPCKIVFVR